MRLVVPRFHLLLPVLVGAVLALASPAVAIDMDMGTPTPHPDSDAPAGAAWSWLPEERWVMERWMPFDEAVLDSRLHITSERLIAWADSGKSLKALAAMHDVRWAGLAGDLVEKTWRDRITPARRATLIARTQRVLDQAHLGQHMLRHEFHTWSVWHHTMEIFGVPRPAFDDADAGLSMTAVATTAGVSVDELQRRLLAATDAGGKRGVTLKQMTRRENAVLRARDRQRLPGWLRASASAMKKPS